MYLYTKTLPFRKSLPLGLWGSLTRAELAYLLSGCCNRLRMEKLLHCQTTSKIKKEEYHGKK